MRGSLELRAWLDELGRVAGRLGVYVERDLRAVSEADVDNLAGIVASIKERLVALQAAKSIGETGAS